MARSKQYFWHVPPGCWYGGAVPLLAASTFSNVAGDIVVPLIDVESAISAKPEIDQYVVTRIVGQYLMNGDEASGSNRILHHRIYPTDADATGFAIRNIAVEDDAETDFLWHKVDAWAASMDGLAYGDWAVVASGGPAGALFGPRRGHFDIKVNRRVEQGRALVWHTQIGPNPVPALPADDTFFLALWLRLLVREG